MSDAQLQQVNNIDLIGRIANGVFNIGAAGVLCWLVISEMPEQRKADAANHIAISNAMNKQSDLISQLATEIRELRRERTAGKVTEAIRQ